MFHSKIRVFKLLIFVLLVMVTRGFSQNQFKIITFNVRSFEPDFETKNYADLLKEVDADVICLNEVENRSSRQMKNGNYRDIVAELANQLGMFYIFGYSYSLNNKDGSLPEESFRFSQNEMYGNAILSKYPILSSNSFLLPRPSHSADQRSALWVDIYLPSNRTVRIVTTHLDHEGGQLEQIKFLINKRGLDTNSPLLIAGDLNSWPQGEVVNYMISKGLERLDSDQGTHMGGSKLDYILGNKQWKLIKTEVLDRFFNHKELSDHYPLVSLLQFVTP